MEYTDFQSKYEAIRKEEVAALNKAIKSLPSQKFCFDEKQAPLVLAAPREWVCPDLVFVTKVVYPISLFHGIFVIPASERDETKEIGYYDVVFGDLSNILNRIPATFH